MKIQNNEIKEKLIQRLRRVEGQVRGVQAMLGEERDCKEIMQQLTAISSAVKATSRTFFQDYASICLSDMEETITENTSSNQQARREKMVQEMITLLDKTP